MNNDHPDNCRNNSRIRMAENAGSRSGPNGEAFSYDV